MTLTSIWARDSPDGNKPFSGIHTRSITALEKRPCNSSTSESMLPAQSAHSAFHIFGDTGSTVAMAQAMAAAIPDARLRIHARHQHAMPIMDAGAVNDELDTLYADGSEVSYQALREIPHLENAIKEALS